MLVKLLNFAGITFKYRVFFTDSASRMNDGSLRGIEFKNRLKAKLCAVTIVDRSRPRMLPCFGHFLCFLCNLLLNLLVFYVSVAPRRFSEDNMNNMVRFLTISPPKLTLFTTLKFE